MITLVYSPSTKTPSTAPSGRQQLHFRAQRVRAAKSRALNEAVARMEAKFEAEDLDRLAEAITRPAA